MPSKFYDSTKDKLLFITEIRDLSERKTRIADVLYFGIKPFNMTSELKKFLLLLQNRHSIFVENGMNNISMNQSNITVETLQFYRNNLPNLIHNIQELKNDVDNLLRRIHRRAPHLIKTGNFTDYARNLIDLDQIEQMHRDAQYAQNYLDHHEVPLVNHNATPVLYEKIDQTLENEHLDILNETTNMHLLRRG